MITVLTLGTYDLLHPGHTRFLSGIKGRGPCQLVVAVNTDEFAARFKRPPIMSFQERVEMLQALPWPDVIVDNDGEDQAALIARWAPCRIVHGDDWTGASYMDQLGVTRPWLEAHRVEIRHVPYTTGVSTSDIIARCEQRASFASAADDNPRVFIRGPEDVREGDIIYDAQTGKRSVERMLH